MAIPPGSSRSDTADSELWARFAEMPPDYVPRTHLWDGNKPRYVNRLIGEGSPYLLQHAHNPVDWRPWGDEALTEAGDRDRPIFLSAGYATCHWCHVMEEESFDNEEVANLLNRHFVPVKLDREQRPEIDHIYILATTLQHRSAGWPNSVWIMPDGRPFHTGTYFQRPHFMQLLQAIAKAWEGAERQELDQFASHLAEGVRKMGARATAPQNLERAPETALKHLIQLHNTTNGGFSSGTQFPHEGYILFLLDQSRRTGDERALAIACQSLDQMEAGGLHDQIGGGFHRYTVDVNWRTPHFEKMLYNQALMLQCMSQAWALTGKDHYARAAERLVAYIERDMTAPDGVFYTAEDADSLTEDGAREEGAFYCWSPEEVQAVLGDAGAMVIETLGLAEPPTLEAGAVPHRVPGQTVDFAGLDPHLDTLRMVREKRPRPIRDDKVIAGWNGLMIRALAEAGVTFDRAEWVSLAKRAMDGVIARLWDGEKLARIHTSNARAEDGNLSDYAWLGLSAIALWDAGERRYSTVAADLTEAFLERFDTDGGRLALVRDGAPLGPVLEMEDSAVPSGESSALECLAMLVHRAPDPARLARARELRDALSGHMSELPVVRLTGLLAARVLDDGESGYLRATDAYVLQVRRTKTGWELDLETREGWHLGGPLLPEGGQPIQVEGAEIKLPDPTKIHAGMRLPIHPVGGALTVTLQICSDTMCRAPEKEVFQVFQ